MACHTSPRRFFVRQFTSSDVVCAAVGVVSAPQNALRPCRQPLPVELANTFAAQWLPYVRMQPALRAKIISPCRNHVRQARYNVWLCRQSLPHIDQKQCLCGFKSALRFLTVSNAYFSTCYTCYQFLTHLSVIITINSITTYLTKRPAHYCIIFDMTNVSLMRLRVLQSYL